MPASCICRRSGTPLLCRQSQAQGGLLARSQAGSTLEPGGNLPAPPRGCRTLVPAQPFTLEQWKGVFLPGLLCMVENRVPGCAVGVGITGCNCYPSWLLGKQLPCGDAECPHVEVSLLPVWFGWSQRTPLARQGFADLLRGAGRMHTTSCPNPRHAQQGCSDTIASPVPPRSRRDLVPQLTLGGSRLPEALADGKERVYANISIPGSKEVITDVMSFLISKVSDFHPRHQFQNLWD